MNAEKLVDRALEPMDSCMPVAISPDVVFANDLAVEHSDIWSSLQ